MTKLSPFTLECDRKCDRKCERNQMLDVVYFALFWRDETVSVLYGNDIFMSELK